MYLMSVIRVCVVSVSAEQLLGCYKENPSCVAGDIRCRVLNFVSAGLTDDHHQLRHCAAACRLTDSLLFAITVSKTTQCSHGVHYIGLCVTRKQLTICRPSGCTVAFGVVSVVVVIGVCNCSQIRTMFNFWCEYRF